MMPFFIEKLISLIPKRKPKAKKKSVGQVYAGSIESINGSLRVYDGKRWDYITIPNHTTQPPRQVANTTHTIGHRNCLACKIHQNRAFSEKIKSDSVRWGYY